MTTSRKKAAKKPKPRTVKRSAVSGRYGDGEKALDVLANDILHTVDIYPRLDQHRHVKEILRAATTVTEAAAEAIGAGWVILDEYDDLTVGDSIEDIAAFIYATEERAAESAGMTERLQYVRLVPAPAPKSRRGK